MIHQEAYSTAQAAPGWCLPTQMRQGQVTHSCCPPASQKAVGKEAWHRPGLPAALPLLLQVKPPAHVRMGSPAVMVYGTLCPDNHSRPVSENLSAHKMSTPRSPVHTRRGDLDPVYSNILSMDKNPCGLCAVTSRPQDPEAWTLCPP